jgi:preprotein translocase subunit SecF
VGEDLRKKALFAMFYALLFITIYISGRFELKWMLSGVVAAALIGAVYIFNLFNVSIPFLALPIIAALLTIIGYSLNDTIIVFDRIRENLRKYHKKPLVFIINRSINETLGRTILTSLTTLVVVVTLFILGGGIIHDFAFALIIGVFVGTYSSIYVASPILLAWQDRGKK